MTPTVLIIVSVVLWHAGLGLLAAHLIVGPGLTDLGVAAGDGAPSAPEVEVDR